MSEKKNRSQLNLRVSSKIKEKWKEYLAKSDFTDLTKLVKYCVNGYIDGLLVEFHKIKNLYDNTHREEQIEKIIEILKEDREVLISKLDTMKKASINGEEIANIQKHKTQILKFLEKVSRATNDEISEVIGVKLAKTQKILNQLEIEQHLIQMNKDSTYELVEKVLE